ncbi:MAG: DUF58 domain-containing protein [Ilumatobacter sp.]|uniref:DUF58 domain-containing protein n=1 Tax=Ilumatobacter sp. TaxID=1967498 RepID=UPI00374FBF6A|nr:DUF58 domain-containing protein [Ilumatobacter sp.]MBT5553109.1 DUF58 domain-containing protein [Ilumatobacter sp.]MBT5863967.1 DUF58 domain-containing protein [Ilumatobacter sp.]
MLTRQGWNCLAAGIIAIVIGRIFAIVELFVIGAGFLVAVMVALLFVRLRRPRVSATRWVHPTVLVAGDTGRVDLRLEYQDAIRSTSFELAERVSRANATDYVARLSVAPLAPGTRSSAGYQLPTTVRGIVQLGPLDVEIRDPLGIATTTAVAAGTDSVTVAPRTYLLKMPVLGQGQLGRHLVVQARRLGQGEFHGLRTYVDGDEPRSIDWKASARSENLFVKEHTVEGLKRCTVVFDANPTSYLDADGFERGVTAAASLVHSSEQAGLTTRFVTSGGIDLRGPETGANTLSVLARIEPDSSPLGQLDRDPGEGLGLIILVTGSHGSAGWRAIQAIVDPTLTTIGVTTDVRSRSAIGVSARSEVEFLDTWSAINGVGA